MSWLNAMSKESGGSVKYWHPLQLLLFEFRNGKPLWVMKALIEQKSPGDMGRPLPGCDLNETCHRFEIRF